MTREEAIEVIKQDIPCEHDTDLIEALEMAIKALSQEPCDDAISRQAVINAIENDCMRGGLGSCFACYNDAQAFRGEIEKLPPVTQKSGKWIKKEDDTCWWYACSECEQEPLKNRWNAEFDLEDGDTMPEHMDLEYKGVKIDFHCRPMWIPFSERLPKPFEHCLITTTDGEVIYHYDDGHYSKYKAWMPLPKPYKAESEENE